MNQRQKLLNDAVSVLAAPPASQLQHLRRLGLPSGVDELALEYDDAFVAAKDMLVRGELNKTQYEALQKLDELLSRMSGPNHSEFWTTEALTSAPEWEDVRKLATDCRRLLST